MLFINNNKEKNGIEPKTVLKDTLIQGTVGLAQCLTPAGAIITDPRTGNNSNFPTHQSLPVDNFVGMVFSLRVSGTSPDDPRRFPSVSGRR